MAMVFDPLSPIASARPRVLLLPAGDITRARFAENVDRLMKENIVRLGDVTPDARPNRTMFSPLAFPSGMILYNFSTALPPPSQLVLSPFELFRETLIVLGIADGASYLDWEDNAATGGQGFGSTLNGESQAGRKSVSDLLKVLSDMQERYSRAIVHHILLFDSSLHESKCPKGVIAVPPVELSKISTMKTVVCDVTSLFLAELTTYARSIQGLPSIESPASVHTSHAANGGHHVGRLSNHSSSPDTRPELQSTSLHSATRDRHRMSMPAQGLPGDTGASIIAQSSRAPTQQTGSRTPPLRTSEETSQPGKIQVESNPALTSLKSSVISIVAETTRDRVPVHGFGLGSLSERARNKGKGRVGLVIGTAFLLAGRWEDAIRELIESASAAKANSDHLWHAKALENILVGLIMLAWTGLDFQIPSVCYPSADKQSSSSLKSNNYSTSTDTRHAGPSPPSVAYRLVSLKNLVNLLPDLLNFILALYGRASSAPEESLPQLAYSEFLIRFGKILAAVHNTGGRLDDDALRNLVLNIPLSVNSAIRSAETNSLPSKVWVNTMIFRAMPSLTFSGGLSVADRVTIYAGMASVLASLGLQRKRSFIMRELVAALIPSLIQARKIGAAELGVHPATGLSRPGAVGDESAGMALLNAEGQNFQAGIEELLGILCHSYGAVGFEDLKEINQSGLPQDLVKAKRDHAQLVSNSEDTNDVVVSRILRHAFLRSYGNLNLKAHVLRCCINLCEALPDFRGVLRFTSALLRTAGSGIAPEAGSHDGSAALSREEQIRLASNIPRTVNAAKQLGLSDVAADYWDEFLIRGVELLEPDVSHRAFPHSKAELTASKAVEEMPEKAPFIFNPFLKKVDHAKAERFLITGELIEFRVTLQNLFDFEVEVQKLRLDTDGVEFAAMEHSTVVGPYRKQTMIVVGVPKAAGLLRVTGCLVQVSGCRERRFPIFSDPWYLVHEAKTRAPEQGLLAPRHQRLSSDVSAQPALNHAALGPKPSIISLTAIERLPLLIMRHISLLQSATMMLQGETEVFSITLQNVSTTTPVDLLLFSSEDSTLSPIQGAMRNKHLSPEEMYELELSARKHALKWNKKTTEFRMEPGESSTLDVEVFAKPGLRSGVVQLDYSNVEPSQESAMERFYTRQLRIPLTITINPSIQLVNADIFSFSSDIHLASLHKKYALKTNNGGALPDDLTSPVAYRTRSLFGKFQWQGEGTDYCLLLLDVRNHWLNPLTVKLHIKEVPSPAVHIPEEEPEHGDIAADAAAYVASNVVQPGHTLRVMLPLPRIHLQEPYASIPTLDPANRRQFVVTSSRSKPKSERQSREAFWCRDAILRMVSGSWEEPGSGRSGVFDLRGIRLNQRMVEAASLKDVSIKMAIARLAPTSGDVDYDTQQFKHYVPTATFVTLGVKLFNRSRKTILPLLRLRPTLRSQIPDTESDISRRFLCNGLMQQPLSSLDPGDSTEIRLVVCILSRGEYQISASVEEVQLQKKSETGHVSPSLGGGIAQINHRQIWHADEPCIVVAMDEIPERNSSGF